MAITDKEKGVWELDQVYNKINQGGIWSYDGLNELYGMGRNENGQLALNIQGSTTNGRSSPTQVSGNWLGYFSEGSAISNGGRAFIGKDTANTLWTWGQNFGGQLGQNNNSAYSSPTQLPGTTWQHCVASSGTMLATKTDGTFWSWGYNSKGQLGRNQGPGNDSGAISSPIQLGTDTTWGTNSNNLAMGNSANSYAIKADGTLWAWGRYVSGNLGQNESEPGRPGYSSPTQVGTDTTWSKLASAVGSGVGAIKTDGSLWTWGGNGYGNLAVNKGPGAPDCPYSSPVRVGTDTNWNSVLLSPGLFIATKTDGTAWVCGSEAGGKLGLGSSSGYYSSPTQLGTDTTWTSAIHGAHPDSIIAAKTDGTLWSWGYNTYGTLGLNNRTNYSSPRQIPGTDWKSSAGSVYGGSNSLFALKAL